MKVLSESSLWDRLRHVILNEEDRKTLRNAFTLGF